jgi:FkbM family methyltransferase
MFNNFNPEQNGELFFINKIKNEIEIIFDIGAADTIYLNIDKEIHYFEPVPSFLEKLKKQENRNKKSIFNNFGLSDSEEILTYYTTHQSFVDRSVSQGHSSKIELNVRKASDYIIEKKIQNIGLVKIDTEGFELKVLKGFGEHIKKIKYIQFEYGGTYKDNNIKLIDVINYLKNNGFDDFCYLGGETLTPINEFSDHYQFSNIVCKNKKI